MNRLELAATNSDLTRSLRPLRERTPQVPVACTPVTVVIGVSAFNIGFAIVHAAVKGHIEPSGPVALTPDAAANLDRMSAGQMLSTYLAA